MIELSLDAAVLIIRVEVGQNRICKVVANPSDEALSQYLEELA